MIDETPPEKTTKSGRKKKQDVIGQLGAGKNNLSGIVDIAVMQSLIQGDDVKELVKDYGLVIVDECHHVSAINFERILKTVNAKYVYGLTATPTRQDGQQAIIFMQCGEIRYKVDAKAQAEKRPFDHFVIPRFTGFKKPILQDDKSWIISKIYNDMADNELRNRLIVNDAITAVENGRSPIILTQRSAHVATLAEELSKSCGNVISLTGGATAKVKRETMQKLQDVPTTEPLIIVATGKYVGEGFDFPRLDTLFLAMPIAWKGTITQYAGRLHRLYDDKNEVLVYDYVDVHVPVLERMYHKRVKGYANIGYKTKAETSAMEKTSIIFDGKSFMPVFSNDVNVSVKEIIIVSPYMRKNRLMQMIGLFSVCIKNSVEITVVTRPPDNFKEIDRETVIQNIELLKGANIKIVFKPNIHQKFAIIDQNTVWYGSVNFLSFGSSEESIMRLESSDIASELLGII